jgi:hypothetical protein
MTGARCVRKKKLYKERRQCWPKKNYVRRGDNVDQQKLYKDGRQCWQKKLYKYFMKRICLPSFSIFLSTLSPLLIYIFLGQHCLPSLYIFFWVKCSICWRGDNVDKKNYIKRGDNVDKKKLYKEGRQCWQKKTI